MEPDNNDKTVVKQDTFQTANWEQSLIIKQ